MHDLITRKKYQIFTPTKIVDEVLALVDGLDKPWGKRILENSCGDGRFLIAIVKRYIEGCRSQNISDNDIATALSRDIVGYELDAEKLECCRRNLDAAARESGLKRMVRWRLFNEDFLRADVEETFDYVIGNPPYLSYPQIPKEDRQYIEKFFETCKEGRWDYCHAFIEKSFLSLSQEGKLYYILPSSIFRIKSSRLIRELILKNLMCVVEYTSGLMFDGVLTSTAIVGIDKKRSEETFKYAVKTRTGQSRWQNIRKANLNNVAGWTFSLQKHKSSGMRFGDYFQVSSSVATLLNSAFVLKGFREENDFFVDDKHRVMIERSLVRKAATPRSMVYNRREYIIFPYRFNALDGRWTLIAEDELKSEYPLAYNYLLSHKDKLLKRDTDYQWYGYGRSQALQVVGRKKLILSQIVTGSASVFVTSEECVPYSGYYVEAKNDFSLEEALRILSSEDFSTYARRVGIPVSGDSVRLSISHIREYHWRGDIAL